MAPRPFLSLLAGLALGSGLAWTADHFAGPASPLPPATLTRAVAAPAGSPAPAPETPPLVLPPPLAGAEADAALDAFLALPPLAKDAPAADIQDRVERLHALLTLLPDSLFARLFAVLATRVGDAEVQVRRAAFDIWCERDSPAAARWALAIVPGEAIDAAARSRYLAQASSAWARDDFASAWAWGSTLADAAFRKAILPGLLAQLASTDPQKALALLPGDDEELARSARRSIFQAWSQRDPAAAIQSLGATLLEQRGQEWPVRQALVKWAAKDPAASIAWAAAQPPVDGESYRALLNNIGWYLTDTPAAVRPFVDALASHDDFAGRDSALQNIVGPWIQKDPRATLAWLDTVSDAARRTDLVARALGYIEAGKPDQLMDLVKLLPTAEAREEAVAGHLSSWAKKDPDAALAWLAAHPGPELTAASRRVESVLLGNLAATDPQAAIARWQALPADAPRTESSIQLAQSWARTDAVAATRWFAGQFSAASSQDPGLAQQIGPMAAGWVKADPAGYADWAQGLPEGVLRDQALNALNGGHWMYDREYDPPPRAAYASQLAQIKDPGLRDRALSSHLAQWMNSDRQAARAWIEASDALSPEAAARILTQDDKNN